MRFLTMAALFGVVAWGAEEITLPLDDGHIQIVPHFMRVNEFGMNVPVFDFTLKNQTSSPWLVVRLQFEISVVQWKTPQLGRSCEHELGLDGRSGIGEEL